MRLSRLKRYRNLHRSAKFLGAGLVLRRHLDLPDDYPIPLTVSHGVDFGQMIGPSEINGVEPIYWACNEIIHQAALSVKPSILIPHPFILAASCTSPKQQAGPLIIGAPPGPQNDARFLQVLYQAGIRSGKVLVKARGNWKPSIAFWKANGFDTINLDPWTSDYYAMSSLLGNHREVVGATVSSALFFAASLGVRVRLLRGYSYRSYEVANFEGLFAKTSKQASETVRILLEGEAEEQGARARQLLGADLDSSPARMREVLNATMAELSQPVHFPKSYPWPAATLLRFAAVRLNRPGLIAEPLSKRIKDIRGRRVVLREMDEVGYWMEGPNATNFRLQRIAYVPGLTEPGFAAKPYD